MYILSVCDIPSVMEVLRIVNMVITIIRIIVPIILIVSAMIELVHAVTNAELNKITKTMVNKVIAAILIFLIPSFVSLIADIAGNNGEYKNCLGNITKEDISQAHIEYLNNLIKKAEESLDKTDYNNALVYLNNIKDEETRNEFYEKLQLIKEKIDGSNGSKDDSPTTGYPNKTYGKCDFVEKNAGGMRYGLCVPSEYKNESIPMIVWLHGSGEVGGSFSTLKGSGLLNVVRDWGSTGLKDIPAIIIAPQLGSGNWSNQNAINGVKAIMDDVMSQYNINKKKVSLIGHSLGGSGVYYIAASNQSYFTSLVMLSGYVNSPSSDSFEYFKNIPMRGYSENGTSTRQFLKSIGKENEARTLNCSHGQVPKVALTLDENQDGISDLIYWMFSN